MRGQALTVPIKPEVDRKAFLAALSGIGGGTGGAVTVPIRLDERQVTQAFATVTRTERLAVDADVDATELVGDTRRAVRVAQATNPTINVDVDVDRPGILRSLTQRINVDADGATIGRRIGASASKGFASSFGSSLRNALPTSPLILLGGAAIGLALAPAISAALTGALLGGAGLGLIGIGALILRENQAVANAAGSLMMTVKRIFKHAASPLIQPFVDAMETVKWAVIEWGPQLHGMFQLLAPAIQPLTEGLIGFVSNVLPGMTELIRESTPFLIRLAGDLPKLGEYIGVFFRIIDGGGPEASLFFSDLINFVGLLITGLGIFIRVATELYPVFRTIVMLSPIGVFIAITKRIYEARDALAGFVAFGQRVLNTYVLAWQVAASRIRGEVQRVIDWLRGLPGRIRSALGNTGSLLYQAGRNIIQGLINGITSRFSGLRSTISNAAGLIRAHLPFSPAKTGPLSGSGNPFYSGQSIAELLAGGMESRLPVVASASSALAGSVGFAGRSSALAPAGGGFSVGWAPGATGDQLLDALRHLIEVRFGGDPGRALGGG